MDEPACTWFSVPDTIINYGHPAGNYTDGKTLKLPTLVQVVICSTVGMGYAVRYRSIRIP